MRLSDKVYYEKFTSFREVEQRRRSTGSLAAPQFGGGLGPEPKRSSCGTFFPAFANAAVNCAIHASRSVLHSSSAQFQWSQRPVRGSISPFSLRAAPIV